MQTVEELIQWMKQEDAYNIVVVGPYIGDYAIMTSEEVETFSLRGLVKKKEAFFEAYEKLVTPATQLALLLEKMEEHFITHRYAQTVNPSFKTKDSNLSYEMLKGDATQFKCLSCHKAYTYEEVVMQKQTLCECGHHIRPMCLLANEKYDLEKIEAFEAELLKATTVFLIGFDFNELECCKQLEVIAAKKQSGDKHMPRVVVVGECDKEGVYETFLPDFIVDEKVETALERFLDFTLIHETPLE